MVYAKTGKVVGRFNTIIQVARKVFVMSKKEKAKRLANPLHLHNCKNRVLLTRNKKKYTRKVKYKKDLYE